MIEDIGEIRDAAERPLLKMWNVSVPAGKRAPRLHSHIAFEFTLACEGTGIYSVGEREHPIFPGDLFVFSSNERHCITSVDAGGLRFLNLHFDPSYLWGRTKDSLSPENFNFCFSHSPRFENRIPAGQSDPLSRLLFEIADALREKQPEYALMVKSLLNLLVIELIRHHAYAAGMTAPNTERSGLIRSTIHYIDDHLAEPISLATLAENAGMTPTYFSTLFHTLTGIRLWDYIHTRRIEAAMQLLKTQPDSNVLDIAVRCGFNNTANFNKRFKKVTGITPSAYRQSKEFII